MNEYFFWHTSLFKIIRFVASYIKSPFSSSATNMNPFCCLSVRRPSVYVIFSVWQQAPCSYTCISPLRMSPLLWVCLAQLPSRAPNRSLGNSQALFSAVFRLPLENVSGWANQTEPIFNAPIALIVKFHIRKKPFLIGSYHTFDLERLS